MALTCRQFADIYKERHVFAKKLEIGEAIDYRLKPMIEYFGDRPSLRYERRMSKTSSPTEEAAHCWSAQDSSRSGAGVHQPHDRDSAPHDERAVGREYIDRTPFRRGTETLVRKLLEDNQRRRRIAEDEEARLLTVAPPLLRSMIIAALGTGMRRGEMPARRSPTSTLRGREHAGTRHGKGKNTR
jgi:hypothetical protein